MQTLEPRFPTPKRTFFLMTLRPSPKPCCAHSKSRGKYSCWHSNGCMRKNTGGTDKQQLAIYQAILQQLPGIIQQPGKILINTWKKITDTKITSSKLSVFQAGTISITFVNFHRNFTHHICLCTKAEQEVGLGLVFLWFSSFKRSVLRQLAKTKFLILKAFYGSKLKFSKHILLIKIGIKCTMEENMPVQNQTLGILLVCPKSILCRICEKSEPDILLQLGVGKRPLEQQSSHICHHFHNSEKIPEHQPGNISKTLFIHLYAFIPFLFSWSSGSLKNTLQKTSSSPFCIPCADYIPFVLMSLGNVLERSWAGSGSGLQLPLLSPEEGLTVLSHIHQKHTKPKLPRRKEKAIVTACVLVCHGNTLLPRRRGNTKGFCVGFLCLPADSSECWMQTHATGVEIFHCSQAALHRYTKITQGFVQLLSFTVFHLDLSNGNMDKLGITENSGSWECCRKLQCHTYKWQTLNATATPLHLLPAVL